MVWWPCYLCILFSGTLTQAGTGTSQSWRMGHQVPDSTMGRVVKCSFRECSY